MQQREELKNQREEGELKQLSLEDLKQQREEESSGDEDGVKASHQAALAGLARDGVSVGSTDSTDSGDEDTMKREDGEDGVRRGGEVERGKFKKGAFVGLNSI